MALEEGKKSLHMEYARLDMLWERYPRYHEMTCFTTLDQLLQDHESYTKDLFSRKVSHPSFLW